jgi:hypothetical protein
LPIGVSRRQAGLAFLAIYEHVLRPALLTTGLPLAILRGDEVLRSGMSLHEGRLWLQEPHLVIADVTTRHSGVLHDLTLRNALADRTVLLSQCAEDFLPCFTTYRQILYTLSEAGVARLQRELQYHLGQILSPVLPARPESTLPGTGRANT